jgi:hypothetical protein
MKVEPFNFRVASKAFTKTPRERRRVFVLGRLLDEVKIDYDNLLPKLRTVNSGIAIQSHLKESNIRHHEQLFGVARNKPQKTITKWLRSGKHSNTNPRHLKQLQEDNIDDLSSEEREALHNHWVEEIRDAIHTRLLVK